MNENTMEQLIKDLCTDLDIRENTEDPKYKKLISKLNSAIRMITRIIKFPPSYTEEMINNHLDKYYDNIKDLTLYDYLQDGATGEVTHNENGTNRTWKSRRECLVGISSFASTV